MTGFRVKIIINVRDKDNFFSDSIIFLIIDLKTINDSCPTDHEGYQ